MTKAILPALPPADFEKDLISRIAMEIGKGTVDYIEWMYPQAIASCSSTFKLSIRNHIHNQIMSAIKVNDPQEMVEWIKRREKHRREMKRLRKKNKNLEVKNDQTR